MDEFESRLIYFTLGFLLCFIVVVVEQLIREEKDRQKDHTKEFKKLSDDIGGFTNPVPSKKFRAYHPSMDQEKVMSGETETYFDESGTQDRIHDLMERK